MQNHAQAWHNFASTRSGHKWAVAWHGMIDHANNDPGAWNTLVQNPAWLIFYRAATEEMTSPAIRENVISSVNLYEEMILGKTITEGLADKEVDARTALRFKMKATRKRLKKLEARMLELKTEIGKSS